MFIPLTCNKKKNYLNYFPTDITDIFSLSIFAFYKAWISKWQYQVLNIRWFLTFIIVRRLLAPVTFLEQSMQNM